jgi:sirohydrochlorin ferrochelatase
LLPVVLILASTGCASNTSARGDGFGVLVMAHGGEAQWNEDVLEAVAPLRETYAVEVAFGMADAAALDDAVAKLESQGAERIAVVRLFVSADSFLERTEQILGLRPGAPPKPATSADAQAHHSQHAEHSMATWRLESSAAFAVSREGLSEAPEMGAVLIDRARALSRDPAHEDVLVLAHGPGDDAENERWLRQMDALAEEVRAALPFARVGVATLREDWPEKREAAEQAVRAYLTETSAAGRLPIVIPFRVSGFGPYAEVLAGLDYEADGRGLLPHAAVTRWIARQAATLRDGGFAGSAAARR